ncbi:hypothetical protein TCON_0639 [Astathelohania contejeani]|uniref:Uncharacterized protein n=1 Tax=Astathelohania contejeani TaxID=164912 RepID=A0ABQ7I1A6_9MICR|nr:hypothetical protein TCON_0639 [Thelohania contejeani]
MADPSLLADKITNQLLNAPSLATEEELRKYTDSIQKDIHDYELMLYEKDTYDREQAQQIARWRTNLLHVTKQPVKLTSQEDKTMFETVQLVSRQISKAASNMKLLGDSTLKLSGLNYTNQDIENEINEARKKLLRNKSNQKKEMGMIWAGFILLALVCLFILIDKFFINKKGIL